MTGRAPAFCAWAAGLVTAVVAVVGRFGFNPTDQGYVLAQAWQVRHGAVPHLEAISSRPLGSAVLHLVDFWLPGPLYLSSMWLSTLELVLATVWLAVLVLDRPVRTWGVPLYALVTAAALVNVHTFPLMAWPTIDGLVLVSGGLLAIVRGRRAGSAALCAVGALACGAAPVTKQSFALAPVLALVLLRVHRDRRWGALACLVLPGALYVAWVVAGGGWGAMTDQLLGGRAAYGHELWSFSVLLLKHSPGLALLCALLIGSLVVLVLAPGSRVRRAAAAAFVLLPAALRGASERVVGGSWGSLVQGATCGVVAVRAVRTRRLPDAGALLLLATAWMVSLSWGYANPDLVSGSLVVLAAREAWHLAGRPSPSAPRAVAAASLATAVGAAALVMVCRQDVYYEGPRSALTRDAGAFAPGLRGVRTTPRTLEYLIGVKDCLREHPAEHVAVLPDNPAIYPLLGLEDPFPQIWVLPAETYGDVPDQLVEAARELGRRGSYLVLFQTYSAFDIDTGTPRVEPEDLFVPGLQQRIARELPGAPVACGSLVGTYQP
jgi:hypothetical protein